MIAGMAAATTSPTAVSPSATASPSVAVARPAAPVTGGLAGKAPKQVYTCSACDHQQPKWSGQCTECGAWNTLEEGFAPSAAAGAAAAAVQRVQPALGELSRLDEVEVGDHRVTPTGIDEVDRVLGGGLLAGSVTLLGGEPGIGKSTMALQVLQSWPGTALYLSGEESPQQVRGRAQRLRPSGGSERADRHPPRGDAGRSGAGERRHSSGLVGGHPAASVNPSAETSDVWIAAETSLRGVLAAIERVQPQFVVVDSIQTIADERIASSPGSTTQVRECAQQLVVEAKRRGMALLIVGHVTKDGALAGPRTLEHVVDTVLSFEGDRHHALRLLRVVKHRFGATSELGLFEMHGSGLVGVPDPSQLFLADRRRGVPGSVVVPTVEGQRPMLVEVQSLTVPMPQGGNPRRTAQGIDTNRLAMLLAVIERRLGLDVGRSEVYASTVGGVRLTEPGSDLGVALAIISSYTDIPVPADLVAIGEVGLGGELRQVVHTERRLHEARRLGYRQAIVPRRGPSVEGIQSIAVDTLADALRWCNRPA